MATKNKSTEKETTEVGRPVETAVGQPLPEFMKGKAGLGTENLSATDIEVPRLKLLQALSPEVQEGGHRPNTFFHTVLDDDIGPSVKIIPVFVDQSFILWRPRQSGGGILARAMDGVHWVPSSGEFSVDLPNKKKVTWRVAPTVQASGLAEWGSSDPSDPNSQPAATRMYNIVAVLPEHQNLSPVVITLQRSAIKVARKFIGKMRLSMAPSYGQVFNMSGFKDSSQAGEFFNFRFQYEGLVEDPVLFQLCEELYNNFKTMGVRIKDDERLEEEAAETGAPPPNKGDY